MKHIRLGSLLMVLISMLAALFMGGCNAEESSGMNITGTLVLVSYSRTNGSVWGDDFHVNMDEKEISYAMYHDGQQHDYHELYDMPITEEQWSQVEHSIRSMMDDVRPVVQPTAWDRFKAKFLSRDVVLLDGGDSDRMMLVWETESGDILETYLTKSSDSYYDLIDLLREMVISGHKEMMK